MIQTYAQRNHVEHSLGEKITFFHLDCLASQVRLNVEFDLTLTVVAALLYQCLGSRLKGFGDSTPYTLWRHFVNTQGRIKIHRREIVVHFEKRSHNKPMPASARPRISRSQPGCCMVLLPQGDGGNDGGAAGLRAGIEPVADQGGVDDLAARAGGQGPIDVEIDLVADQPHRAVGH